MLVGVGAGADGEGAFGDVGPVGAVPNSHMPPLQTPGLQHSELLMQVS